MNECCVLPVVLCCCWLLAAGCCNAGRPALFSQSFRLVLIASLLSLLFAAVQPPHSSINYQPLCFCHSLVCCCRLSFLLLLLPAQQLLLSAPIQCSHGWTARWVDGVLFTVRSGNHCSLVASLCAPVFRASSLIAPLRVHYPHSRYVATQQMSHVIGPSSLKAALREQQHSAPHTTATINRSTAPVSNDCGRHSDNVRLAGV